MQGQVKPCQKSGYFLVLRVFLFEVTCASRKMCFRLHISLDRLPELIGLSRALDVILTGRIIEAPEALQMGLVNRVCGTGTAYGRAMHLAKELQAHPQVGDMAWSDRY